MHLPQVRVWHGQGQTARQVSVAARIEYWRSRYIYFKKNNGPAARMILVCGLLLRLLFDSVAAGLCVLLTLGRSERWRNRWRVCSALIVWHLRGCPREAGLPR
jgi:GT2 family glycosyltransferase